MSRTTKTRPLHVRIDDPTDHKVGRVEVHHHEDGVCTLPSSAAVTGRCFTTFGYRGVNPCGCPICTDQLGRRVARRRDRHRIRAALHQVVVGVSDPVF